MWKIAKSYSESFTIGKNELEKAIYCFITGKPVVFKSGAALRHIESILPDYNAAMGWNEGYKLTADDHADIRKQGMDEKLRRDYQEMNNRVKYLVDHKQENLIGKNVEIAGLLDFPQSQKERDN